MIRETHLARHTTALYSSPTRRALKRFGQSISGTEFEDARDAHDVAGCGDNRPKRSTRISIVQHHHKCTIARCQTWNYAAQLRVNTGPSKHYELIVAAECGGLCGVGQSTGFCHRSSTNSKFIHNGWSCDLQHRERQQQHVDSRPPRARACPCMTLVHCKSTEHTL